MRPELLLVIAALMGGYAGHCFARSANIRDKQLGPLRARISELEAQLAVDKPIADRVRHIRSLELAPGFPDAERVVAAEAAREGLETEREQIRHAPSGETEP